MSLAVTGIVTSAKKEKEKTAKKQTRLRSDICREQYQAAETKLLRFPLQRQQIVNITNKHKYWQLRPPPPVLSFLSFFFHFDAKLPMIQAYDLRGERGQSYIFGAVARGVSTSWYMRMYQAYLVCARTCAQTDQPKTSKSKSSGSSPPRGIFTRIHCRSMLAACLRSTARPRTLAVCFSTVEHSEKEKFASIGK